MHPWDMEEGQTVGDRHARSPGRFQPVVGWSDDSEPLEALRSPGHTVSVSIRLSEFEDIWS